MKLSRILLSLWTLLLICTAVVLSQQQNFSPPNVAQVNLTAQAANISGTTFYTTPAAGFYRASCFIIITQAATTSSTIPNCNIIWTDNDTGIVENGQPCNSLIGTTNTVGAYCGISGVFPIIPTTFYAKASTNIQYSTTAYASTGATPMQYAIHVRLEFIGL